jgi:hypothetical protein
MLPVYPIIYLSHFIVRYFSLPQIPVILFGYLVAGITRGYTLEFGLFASGVLAIESPTFRVISGASLVTILASIIASIWVTYLNLRQRLENLFAETQSLQKIGDEIEFLSRESNKNFSFDFTHRILGQLSLMKSLKREQQVSELEHMIDNVVKPLSKAYAFDVSAQEQTRQTKRIKLADFWRELSPFDNLPNPLIASLFAALVGFASAFAVFGFQNTVELLIVTTVSLSISMWIVFRLLRRWFSHLKSPLRDFVITLSFILVTLPPALGSQFVLRDTNNSDAYVLAELMLFPLFGWFMLIGNAAYSRAIELLTELRNTNFDLKWSNARLNLLNWYYRGIASRLLHGPIQNSIQVAVLNLNQQRQNSPSEVEVEKVIDTIERAISSSLDFEESARADLESISKLTATWNGIAQLTINQTDECRGALEKDPPGAGIVMDIVQELISNAIRHGKAKNVDVMMTLQQNTVIIKLTSDQQLSSESTVHSGLGTKFIADCSIESEIALRDDASLVTTVVPIVLSKSN